MLVKWWNTYIHLCIYRQILLRPLPKSLKNFSWQERAQGDLINGYNHLMGGSKDDKARLFETRRDTALSSLLSVTLLWAGGWTRQSPEAPSSLQFGGLGAPWTDALLRAGVMSLPPAAQHKGITEVKQGRSLILWVLLLKAWNYLSC